MDKLFNGLRRLETLGPLLEKSLPRSHPIDDLMIEGNTIETVSDVIAIIEIIGKKFDDRETKDEIRHGISYFGLFASLKRTYNVEGDKIVEVVEILVEYLESMNLKDNGLESKFRKFSIDPIERIYNRSLEGINYFIELFGKDFVSRKLNDVLYFTRSYNIENLNETADDLLEIIIDRQILE